MRLVLGIFHQEHPNGKFSTVGILKEEYWWANYEFFIKVRPVLSAFSRKLWRNFLQSSQKMESSSSGSLILSMETLRASSLLSKRPEFTTKNEKAIQNFVKD